MQSNGILRSDDFVRLLKRHPEERGICSVDEFLLKHFWLRFFSCFAFVDTSAGDVCSFGHTQANFSG